MIELLGKDVTGRRAELREAFERAEPFPHLVMDDFLEPSFCSALVREFPAFESGDFLDERGLPALKSHQESVREIGEAYRRLDDLVSSEAFLALMTELTGIPELLYDPDYVSAGTHENRPGQDLNPHVDFNRHPALGWHRRLNLLLYLNEEWEEDWGGALELHRDPREPARDRVRSILPSLNRCVLFATSERSWHGFRRIAPPAHRPALSRRGFVLYLYTRDAPAEQVARSHSTVYVERPLPERFAPGTPTARDDAELVQRAIRRRREHARMLFDRDERMTRRAGELAGQALREAAGRPLDAELHGRIAGLLREQDELLARLYERELSLGDAIDTLHARLGVDASPRPFPLEGPGALRGRCAGYMPDGWMLPELSFGLETRGEIGALRIVGALPPVLEQGPGGLALEVDGRALARLAPLEAGGVVDWRVPVELAPGREVRVRLRASGWLNQERAGLGSDDRDLAMRVDRIVLVPRDGTASERDATSSEPGGPSGRPG